MIKTISFLAFLVIHSLVISQTITNYTTADGLPDNDVTCLVHDGNGAMWFGTQKGGWQSLMGLTGSPTIPSLIQCCHKME